MFKLMISTVSAAPALWAYYVPDQDYLERSAINGKDIVVFRNGIHERSIPAKRTERGNL